MTEQIRNIAIVAHVDHGKTTLVDCLLKQSGTLGERAAPRERIMDTNELERERGITILAKNTAIRWRDYRINIVDTPGHADFGGEVERILSMVDSVLLLVDAVDGPMPQTRFVTQKAFARGLRPIVVINKIDREGARPGWVLDRTFDLFDRLGATEQQLDFPVVYTSATGGYAELHPQVRSGDMMPLLETIVQHVPPPSIEADALFQMQVSSLDYSSYVGAIGIGRIARGALRPNTAVTVVDRDGTKRAARVLHVLRFLGLERREATEAQAGDIVAVTGIEGMRISDTLCDPNRPEALPTLVVDEPTVSMSFQISDSPLAGREGKFITSRHLRERLQRELIHNVALRLQETDTANRFLVAGRGSLHLAILIETMRRETYEFSVGRPQVIVKEIDGRACEPYEQLAIDVEVAYQGAVMQCLGPRQAQLKAVQPIGPGRVRLEYLIPSRGLIGLRTEFLTATSGSGLIYHNFDHYGTLKRGPIAQRANGVMIANRSGKSLAYALFNLQERGRLFVAPGEEVYEGMIIGMHSRSNDIVVNPMKAKQLTNIRAAGSDENVILTPALRLDLEQALEFIDDDELVEITPRAIRLRKKLLNEHERKRASRAASA